MKFNDFMNKVRHWDNRAAQWMIKHFYILFFEFILVAIFIAVFINTIKIIDVTSLIDRGNITDRILATLSTNTLLIVILLLFNSFWMLYIFSSLIRMRGILKNMDFNLSRRNSEDRRQKPRDE